MNPTANLVQVMREPFPLWLVVSESAADWPLSLDLFEVERLTDTLGCQFRGVALDRLTAVVSTGIDVDPTDSVIFVADLQKALEYGGMPKVILAVDPRQLDHTFREIPADTHEDEVALIRRTFPTVRPSSDGQTLWCSRLDEASPRLGPYEVSYGRWVPGEPHDALQAVLIFLGQDHRSDVMGAIELAYSSGARPLVATDPERDVS